MIGILNTGGEYTEFYCTNPASSSQSVFARKTRKPMVTYSKGGRVFVNGEPQVKVNPKELWDNLLSRAVSNSAIISTLKVAGLESKSENSAEDDVMDYRKVNSEANIPQLVTPVMLPMSTDRGKTHCVQPMKLFRRHRRSSSC
uniref:Doublecortin domain-containing protein n=1 Tax=Syphacia muris TaxID=451379 RepID=A0A0N5AHI9_9BILA